jgi:hypothetical protein
MDAGGMSLVMSVGAGLYWWFGRGRPIGLLFGVLASTVPTYTALWLLMKSELHARQAEPYWAAITIWCFLFPVVLLYVGWRLPKRARRSA